MEGNDLVYYDYNWIYPIKIHYAEKSVYKASDATISEVWERPTPLVLSIDTFGTNNHSRFCIPGNWVGWGSDLVPGVPVKNLLNEGEFYNIKIEINGTDQ